MLSGMKQGLAEALRDFIESRNLMPRFENYCRGCGGELCIYCQLKNKKLNFLVRQRSVFSSRSCRVLSLQQSGMNLAFGCTNM